MSDQSLKKRLEGISKCSINGERAKNLYQLLVNKPEIWELAYANINANAGATTKGVDGVTADGHSVERSREIMNQLRNGTYRPKPARRVYIPKSNGKQRPLGIPTFMDRLVQEACRIILEAIYEPVFSKFSFGNQKQRVNPASVTASPGPVYEPKGTKHGAMGRPQYSFGNDVRGKNRDPSLRTPGPGNYNQKSSMGLQVYSTQRSAMVIGFGTPGRGEGGRGILPLEGRASPGPIYMNAGGLRKQALSDRRTAEVTAFTRADRFNGPGSEAAATATPGPGPGEYIV